MKQIFKVLFLLILVNLSWANEYYDHSPHNITPGARARAQQINDIGNAVETGLDKLPTETQLKQTSPYLGTDSGSANTYVVTRTHTITSYTNGLIVIFKAANANTGASTVNVDSQGVKSIKRSDGTDLLANDIKGWTTLRYDSTDGYFYLIHAALALSDAGTLDTLDSTQFLRSDTSDTMTGSLTITGNVDGRDVSTDGTKLDGIESGATADQTKADIDALGINADQLDGQEGVYYQQNVIDVANIEINQSGTGDRYAFVDFHGDDDASTTDYSARIIRENTGVNADFKIQSLGTGDIALEPFGGNVTVNGSRILTISDEGTGNGLDADTVDSLEASQFLRSDTADTTTGTLTLDIDSVPATIVDGAAGTYRYNRFTTSGTVRWDVGVNNAAESGSNVGTDFTFTRFTDAGAAIDTPLYITRSSGLVTVANDLSVTGNVGVGTASPTEKLDINSDTLRIRTAKTPASASEACDAGTIAWDASYLYICTATNAWERAAIATW